MKVSKESSQRKFNKKSFNRGIGRLFGSSKGWRSVREIATVICYYHIRPMGLKEVSQVILTKDRTGVRKV